MGTVVAGMGAVSKNAATAVLIAALVAGCGASAPEVVVGDFVAAYSDSDYEKACDLLTTDTQEDIGLIATLEGSFDDSSDGLQGLPDSPETGSPAGCPQGLEVSREDFEDELTEAKNAEVEDSDESGDTATVTTSQGEWHLEEQDDEWRIASNPFNK